MACEKKENESNEMWLLKQIEELDEEIEQGKRNGESLGSVNYKEHLRDRYVKILNELILLIDIKRYYVKDLESRGKSQ